MYRTANVAHSRDGFELHVIDTPWWASAVRATGEEALEILGHPCCGRGIGRIGPICALAFRILQLVHRPEFRHGRKLLEVAITADQARHLNPEFVDDCEDLI